MILVDVIWVGSDYLVIGWLIFKLDDFGVVVEVVVVEIDGVF